jgi:hypothetical protein
MCLSLSDVKEVACKHITDTGTVETFYLSTTDKVVFFQVWVYVDGEDTQIRLSCCSTIDVDCVSFMFEENGENRTQICRSIAQIEDFIQERIRLHVEERRFQSGRVHT